MGARIAALTSQSYVGFELDHDSYERAKSRIEPLGGAVYDQPLAVVAPAAADLLCAFEVLEHIQDDHTALREWKDYVVPGGHVLLSIPANERRFGPMDTHAGHYRRYSPEGIRDVAESVGLVDVTTLLYGAPLGYALEAVRNRIDARRLAGLNGGDGPSPETLSAASGRTFQFDQRSWKSALATAGTTPFKYLQRIWPGGVGLVMLARKALT
jgi:SAM-dependent methyltransferase